MSPPSWRTIPYTVESPIPLPLPMALVVKNGSKMWLRVSGVIPLPVSLTVSTP